MFTGQIPMVHDFAASPILFTRKMPIFVRETPISG
jgi:hypothetical protein